MCDCNRRGFIWGAASFGAAAGLVTSAMAAQPAGQPTDKPKVYVCPPCGCPNDGKEFAAPGDCTACAMPLVEKPAPAPASPEKPSAE